ncbi:MAG: hypothetical protein AVDCRST_MAG59-838, partial [uncultured Thermomicrobiales bacterium]
APRLPGVADGRPGRRRRRHGHAGADGGVRPRGRRAVPRPRRPRARGLPRLRLGRARRQGVPQPGRRQGDGRRRAAGQPRRPPRRQHRPARRRLRHRPRRDRPLGEALGVRRRSRNGGGADRGGTV